MNLELRSLVKPGDLPTERVTLRAKVDLDLGDYLFAQSGYADGVPTINFFHTYWFQYKKISAGDLVVIYSKEGSESSKKLTTGKMAHFYYLDLKSTIWDDPNKAAVILYAPKWESKSVDDF
jgi:hypothetical protein